LKLIFCQKNDNSKNNNYDDIFDISQFRMTVKRIN